MSGHSKWSSIKHQKGVVDARRGQLFTKLARELTVTAREGGVDSAMNFRLRLVVQRARAANMPLDNIERAIKRASGLGEGGQLEEIFYEGYGPGGAAIMLQVLTDNRNRTASEVRNVFSRSGGNLGESGCVAWMFSNKGVLAVEAESEEQAEEIALAAIEAGADDFKQEGTYLEVYSNPSDFEALQQTLSEQGLNITLAEISMVPSASVAVEDRIAERNLRLIDKLEELDDVQKVYTNADFPDAVLEAFQS
jgi:YebC/PmpR family DNA-binding regulatory protein